MVGKFVSTLGVETILPTLHLYLLIITNFGEALIIKHEIWF